MMLLEELPDLKIGARPPPPSRHWLLRSAALLTLSGLLIFAHGCHPDEDTELFALVRWVQWMWGH